MIPVEKIQNGDFVELQARDPIDSDERIYGRVRKVHVEHGTIVVDWDDGETSSVRVLSPALLSVGPYKNY